MTHRISTIAFILIYTAARQIFAASADLVIRNGHFITMEKDQPAATAMAISKDRISWLGTDAAANDWIGPNTKILDLHDSYVYPGFIDSHAHIVSLGSSRVQIDLTGTTDKQTVISRVKERVTASKPGEWVLGRGWDQNDWPEKSFPNAQDLDSVSPNNPVVLERIDGHAYWVNSNALKRANITAQTKEPEGGKIHRDPQGNPTGILVDRATNLVDAVMKALTPAEETQRTLLALREAAQKGLTMVIDAGSSQGDLQAWKALVRKQELPVRIYSMVWMPSQFGETFLQHGPEDHGPYLNVRAIKMVIDGALGSRGASLLQPYSDDPGNSGLLMWKEDDLARVLTASKAKGIQIAIHAIGDRANRIVLDAYEKLGVQGLRWRIEHVQVLAPPDIPRLAKLDVIASMQPTHATSDMPWATDRLGAERVKGAYAWRSLLDQHTLIAGGSDAPVEDINPLWGIYAAVTRQDQNGKPQGGWHPEQLVNREEALRMFTIDAAYAAFRENDVGSLKVGKLADIVVLPEDLLTCEPKDMIDMKVLYTIVGGKIQFSSKEKSMTHPGRDTSASGSLTGKVTIRPVHNIDRPGVSNEAAPEVYLQHKVVILGEDSKTEIKRLDLDSHGNFSAELPPGTYWIDVIPHDIGIRNINRAQKVTIESGKTAKQDIELDTGIR